MLKESVLAVSYLFLDWILLCSTPNLGTVSYKCSNPAQNRALWSCSQTPADYQKPVGGSLDYLDSSSERLGYDYGSVDSVGQEQGKGIQRE